MKSNITTQFIPTDGITDLSPELLESNRLKLFHAEHYKKYKWNDLRLFCHYYARYGLPTIELVDYIKMLIHGRSAIEIGAGAGDLGFHLGIKMTDSYQQTDPLIKMIYEAMGQPVITYPPDVEKIDALDAVIKYQPKVVVASWITSHSPTQQVYCSNPEGIKEAKILDLIDTFIIIGNIDVHGTKPILKIGHAVIQEPWIVSRAKNQSHNCIYIWDKHNV